MNAYLKDNRTGEETPFKTKLDWQRFDDRLVFKFDCENSELFSAFDKDNEPIYKGDVVEVFVCTCGDRHKYYEIEVAPNGTKFFAEILNKDGIHAQMLDASMLSAKVTTRKNGYSVEISVSNDVIGVKKFGEVVFNAYRIETEGGVREKNLLALNPTLCGTFHMPQFFVDLN